MGSWRGTEIGDLTLAGGRLTLRAFQAADAVTVFEAAQDRLMHEFLPLPDPYTRADADSYIADVCGAGRADGSRLGCAVVETATDRLVGSAALRLPIPGYPDAEIGYATYPWGRGRGYAGEAARVLADWAFEHGIARVIIRCSVRNLASANSALAAGFSFETLQPQGPDEDEDALFVRLVGDSGDRPTPVLPPLPLGGLGDGVLGLRLTAPADADAMIEEHSDPVSRSWDFDDKPIDPVAVRARAARAALQWQVGPVGQLAMIDLATGAVAGSAQLRVSGPPGVAAIGYGVRAAFRGRGYTTRALRLLSAWAFTEGGFNRLELGAKVANIASQKSALNAGFRPDGISPARLRNPDGTFSDEAQFALIRP